MQFEPHDGRDGYKVWLNTHESDLLRNHYSGKKKLAVLLMLDSGMRSEETTRICLDDIRRLESDEEAYMVRFSGKDTTGTLADGKWREAPISKEAVEIIDTLASVKGRTRNDPAIDVGKRTVQRWVEDAREDLAEQTGDDDWLELSAHDLRRSWATRTYYSLNASESEKSIIMRWGGWTKQSTFEENYLGRPPDELAADMMEAAGLR
ncbi:site-specific integrase [Halobaculum limi]|uniref:site-specific integrase n=1 Tax=Halobaculum limi TaxID=3031916 RepID=UPI0024052F32|nr:site-specific integrase [Halobaculum sp. YSMS11]